MDLVSFLRPEADLLVKIAVEEEGVIPLIEGRLMTRRGRPVWFCAAPQPTGRALILSLELPSFNLAEDGGLEAAGPEYSAPIYLLSRVRGCRYFPPRTAYLLRLELLGRIWPEPSNPRCAEAWKTL
jgi:hypothetical protein